MKYCLSMFFSLLTSIYAIIIYIIHERIKTMAVFDNIEDAREYFKGEKFATGAGMQIDEMTDEYVTCSVLVEERHQNALGGVMGGAIFTLADFAFAVMVNNIHRPTVAQNISIIFLNSPKGKKMFAKAVCKKDGRTTCVVNVDVYDEEDRPIAQFTGTGFKK